MHRWECKSIHKTTDKSQTDQPILQAGISNHLEVFQRTPIVYMQEQNFLLGSDRADPALEVKEKEIGYFLAWTLFPAELERLLQAYFNFLLKSKEVFP